MARAEPKAVAMLPAASGPKLRPAAETFVRSSDGQTARGSIPTAREKHEPCGADIGCIDGNALSEIDMAITIQVHRDHLAKEVGGLKSEACLKRSVASTQQNRSAP